jgi:hypothetical protein
LRKPYQRAEMVAIVQRVMEAGNERSAEPEVLITRL